MKQIWLSFWCVFGAFQTIEQFAGCVLCFIPYWSWVRLGFFIYLMNPITEGSKMFYEKFFSPLLKQHRSEIEALIAKVSSQASEVGKDALK